MTVVYLLAVVAELTLIILNFAAATGWLPFWLVARLARWQTGPWPVIPGIVSVAILSHPGPPLNLAILLPFLRIYFLIQIGAARLG